MPIPGVLLHYYPDTELKSKKITPPQTKAGFNSSWFVQLKGCQVFVESTCGRNSETDFRGRPFDGINLVQSLLI